MNFVRIILFLNTRSHINLWRITEEIHSFHFSMIQCIIQNTYYTLALLETHKITMIVEEKRERGKKRLFCYNIVTLNDKNSHKYGCVRGKCTRMVIITCSSMHSRKFGCARLWTDWTYTPRMYIICIYNSCLLLPRYSVDYYNLRVWHSSMCNEILHFLCIYIHTQWNNCNYYVKVYVNFLFVEA